MDLVMIIYDLTSNFPKEEVYGLSSQIKRCCVSIPSNIAEGSRRFSKKDFKHFLTIAYGSGAELETQLELAKRLKFIEDKSYQKAESLLIEIMKMLNKLIRNLGQ
jgi:four helix bundle protein